jgi:hypothetical protein
MRLGAFTAVSTKSTTFYFVYSGRGLPTFCLCVRLILQASRWRQEDPLTVLKFKQEYKGSYLTRHTPIFLTHGGFFFNYAEICISWH